MEMGHVSEFQHEHTMDRRPMKRPRFAWDAPPAQPPAQSGIFSGQEVGNFASFGSSRVNLNNDSLYGKGLASKGSPPRRSDDKDGHYVFSLGENLTPRYKILRKIGEVMHDLNLIHTDLKPENILFVSPEYVKVPDYKAPSRKIESFYRRFPKSSAIKVIDFGSVAYEHQDHSYIVSTRHYRAPEIILGLGWSYPCDIWSVGCILVELCLGEALFQTHENLEHLAMMERVLGPLPQHMLKRADRHAEKYVRRARLAWPEGATSRESIRAVLKLSQLQNLIMQHVDHSAGDLIHLLHGLLKYDPSERLTPHEALRHPFFTRFPHRGI